MTFIWKINLGASFKQDALQHGRRLDDLSGPCLGDLNDSGAMSSVNQKTSPDVTLKLRTAPESMTKATKRLENA